LIALAFCQAYNYWYMNIPSPIQTAVREAEARALATTGPHGVNVVPVSVVHVTDEAIHLYNFFMGKTVENLLVEPAVALTVWKGLSGVQIKATASYVTSGEVFEAAVATMKVRFPERTLSGVIILTPMSIYDTSAGNTAGTKLA
jgi:predicted pyridoxine 5'-phosphate oxidase superfamily flavin-nucleotide-binding protein